MAAHEQRRHRQPLRIKGQAVTHHHRPTQFNRRRTKWSMLRPDEWRRRFVARRRGSHLLWRQAGEWFEMRGLQILMIEALVVWLPVSVAVLLWRAVRR